MLEKSLSKSEASLISKMLESGLINYRHYMCWADERILAEKDPGMWLLELAQTKSSKIAAYHLYSFINSEPPDSLDHISCHDQFIACMWIRYETGDISWASFLMECGQYTDGNDGRKGCEYYYILLNSYEDSNYSEIVEKKQTKKILRAFSDVIDETKEKYLEFIPYYKQFLAVYGA